MNKGDGQIEFCKHQECQYRCCDFGADNFIALYPGELDYATENGWSVGHLDCSPDEFGGHWAICRAKETSTCDGGYKPLDCRSYPFFPTIDSETEVLRTGLKGEKCPLQAFHLADHQLWVIEQWNNLIEKFPSISVWLRRINLVGYVSWDADAVSTSVTPESDNTVAVSRPES